MCITVNFKVKKKKNSGGMYKFPFQPVTMLGQFYFLTIPLSNILLPYLTPELLHLFPITRSVSPDFPVILT